MRCCHALRAERLTGGAWIQSPIESLAKKAVRRERLKRDFGFAAAQELRDQAAGPRRADQADMAVAERIDNILRGPRITDAGTAVGHAWPVPEPDLDARCRNRLREFWKHAEQML